MNAVAIWESYRKLYFNHMLSLGQINLLAQVAREVLEQFPERLPESLRTSLRANMKDFCRALGIALSDVNGRELLPCAAEKPMNASLIEMKSDLFSDYLRIIQSQVEVGHRRPLQVGFERLVQSQRLVMHFAYLDAFMSDSLRFICQVHPAIMRNDKKMEWGAILSHDGWEDLINHLIERYVSEYGWQPLSQRVSFLRDHLEILTTYPDCEVEVLWKAERVRHLIVHNGGRINEDFAAKTGRSDLLIGELIPVSREYVEKLSSTARLFASDLFVDVSKRYFGVDDSELNGIWRRSEHNSQT